MRIFELLDRESKARHLRPLLIGSHAVNAYGYTRFTSDVDFIISKEDPDARLTGLLALDFQLQYDGGNVLQYGSKEIYGKILLFQS